MVLLGWEHFLHRFIRHVDRAILIPAIVVTGKKVLLLLNNPDHCERLVVDDDLLAQRLQVRKELVGDIIAYYAYVSTMLVFDFCEETPFPYVHRRHALVIGSRSLHLSDVQLLILISDLLHIVGTQEWSNVLDGRALLFDGHRVFVADGCAHALFRRQAASVNARIELINENGISAERFNVLLELLIEPRDKRRDHHDRHSTDDDAEHGQEGTELMRVQGCERHPKAFSCVLFAHINSS